MPIRSNRRTTRGGRCRPGTPLRAFFLVTAFLSAAGLPASLPAQSLLDERTARTQETLERSGLFGTDEFEYFRFDEGPVIDVAADGERMNLMFLGNVVIAGYGFELHADAIGIWIDGLDEEDRPIRPRLFASGNILLLRDDQSFRAESLFIDRDSRTAVFTEMRLRITQELIETLRTEPVGNPQRARSILEAFGAAGEVEESTVTTSTPIVFAARSLTIRDFEEISGEGITFTTCEFGHPHWGLEAKAGRAEERQEKKPIPGEQDPGGWLFELESITLRAGPVPVPLLPGVVWDSRWGRYLPIRSVSYSSSGKFGNRIDTLWNGNLLLPSALSKEMDLGLRLDYLSERGTGYGVDVEWGRDPSRWAYRPDGRVELFGTGQWWAIDDRGEDRDGTMPSDSDRHRSRFHQRMRLQTGTWIDIEYSDESDENFLLEYFEEEARGGKTPENLIFVRQPIARTGQLSILYSRQGVDHRTVLERLPEMRAVWVEDTEPVTGAILDFEGSIGEFDLEPADGSSLTAAENQRADVRLLVARPLEVTRGVRFRPFIEGRYTYWDRDLLDDEEDRVAWAAGGTLSTRIWRTFALDVPSLDIHGLRHVVDFDITFESLFDTNVEPAELVILDEVEQIDERESVTLALFQRFFTRRLGNDLAAERGYSIRSVLDSRLEIEWFPEKERDNNGESWGPLEGEILVTPFDRLGVFVDGTVNFQDGDVEELNTGIRWLEPRALIFEAANRRRRHQQDALVLGGRWWGSEKYEFGAFAELDLRRHRTVNQRYEVTRNFHRFAASFSIEFDEGEDNTTFHVNFGPRDLFGSRRRYGGTD